MATVDYDSGDPPGQLEQVLKHSEWKSFETRRKQSERRGKLRGIACAMFIEPAGASVAPKEEAFIKFGDSGNAIVYALAGPSGSCSRTTAQASAASPWSRASGPRRRIAASL